MKPLIDGIVVVEGTNDASLINSLVNAEVVTLNGCELQNIKYLNLASKFTNIYLLTDPDAEGIRIREKFNKLIPNVINIEIDIKKCTKGIKNGVAECENNEVLRAISPYFVDYLENDVSVSNLIFTKEERNKICSSLGIELVNNKQLIKRLNRLKITDKQIRKIIEE